MTATPLLRTRNLSVGYVTKNKPSAIRAHLNLSVYPSDLIAIIGPNGCGKSTLLRTLAGLQEPLNGEIFIEEENLKKKSYKEKAKLISVVLTDRVQTNGLTVYELIAMGRYPYTNWMSKLSASDKEKIDNAISLIDLIGFENRNMAELSDGEKQRVMIAKALVQDTPLLFLDEPTAHLDLNNRIEILSLLRKISRQTQKAILFSTHELDLALKLANRVWLPAKDANLLDVTPQDVIDNNLLSEVFPNNMLHFNQEGSLVYNL